MASWLSTKKERDWTLYGILLIAFLFRFLFLALKPPHFDEGINGWFTDQVISNGFYNYDPTNYHGPFHFYVLLVFKILFGRNLWALRLSASIFGFIGIYLIAKLDRYVGKFTAYAAALLAAVSPGMIFYTRYAIHESELLFFSLLALHGFLRFKTEKDRLSLWFMGIGIAGMAVTKETFIVHLACFGVAYLVLWVYEKYVLKTAKAVHVPVKYTDDDLAWAWAASLLFFVVFYSGFFLHPTGIQDFFRSFQAWMDTGNKGNGHQKPWWYWGQLFTKYELAAFAGLILSAYVIFPVPRWLRLITIYAVGVFMAYSIVAYKTPWCILNIVWPFFLVPAAILASLAVHGRAMRIASYVVLAGCVIFASVQSIALNFYNYTDEKEPYVYVQTFSDVMTIYSKAMDLVKKDVTNYHMSVKLFMDSNWPIPWLFGDFTKTAYFSSLGTMDPNADLIMADEKNRALIESRLTKPYYTMRFRLRSAQEPSVAYFDAETFKGEFADDMATFKPKPPEPLKPGAGLLAQYFQNPNWTGTPVMKKVVAKPDFSAGDQERPLPAPFSIEYTGEIRIPDSGKKTFYLSSDDGSELFIDGKSIVQNLGAHADQMRSGNVELSKGWHKFKLHYNDFGGGMVLRLWWDGNNGIQQDIDPSLYRIKEVPEAAK